MMSYLRFIPVRRFSVGRGLMNEAVKASVESSVKSSCVSGTVLNLKIRKNGDEPVALEDSEYPAWLWDCLDKQKVDQQLKETDFMKWRKKQLNKKNTARIKDSNFLSKM